MEDSTILKIVGIVVVGALYAFGIYEGLDPTFGSLSLVLSAIVGFVGYSAGHVAGSTLEKMKFLKGVHP